MDGLSPALERGEVDEVVDNRLSAGMMTGFLDVRVKLKGSGLERVSAAELLGTVRRLPARDRELIALRFGADLDTAAVGAAVGLSAESARRAIGRALERVRVLIKEADHE